jgi:hypothetical protein
VFSTLTRRRVFIFKTFPTSLGAWVFGRRYVFSLKMNEKKKLLDFLKLTTIAPLLNYLGSLGEVNHDDLAYLGRRLRAQKIFNVNNTR